MCSWRRVWIWCLAFPPNSPSSTSLCKLIELPSWRSLSQMNNWRGDVITWTCPSRAGGAKAQQGTVGSISQEKLMLGSFPVLIFPWHLCVLSFSELSRAGATPEVSAVFSHRFLFALFDVWKHKILHSCSFPTKCLHFSRGFSGFGSDLVILAALQISSKLNHLENIFSCSKSFLFFFL